MNHEIENRIRLAAHYWKEFGFIEIHRSRYSESRYFMWRANPSIRVRVSAHKDTHPQPMRFNFDVLPLKTSGEIRAAVSRLYAEIKTFQGSRHEIRTLLPIGNR